MTTKLIGIDDLDNFLAEIVKIPEETDRINTLCDVVLDGFGPLTMPENPFSSEYHSAAVEIWKRISGLAEYNPTINEQSPYLEEAKTRY